MKGPLDRTKVVLRHLPPTITQSNLVEQVDSSFSGRYRSLTFRPGKSSLKHVIHSRVYIDFNKPEDVYEFAESFNNHVFVNEKGTQFKVIVEYAPSQRVPKQWSKKDGREGTLMKDPDYLEFLEILAKPVENLPSAEIQLERKEAERAGAPKDAPIITPLMDYVRQKRAAKSGARRTVLNGKPTRRVGSISGRMRDASSSKRPPGKKNPATMYVLRENSKGVSSKDKSINSLVQKDDSQQLKEKSINLKVVSRIDALEGGIGGSESVETGKKKILLLKGKGKESNVSTGSPTPQDATPPARNPPPRQTQRCEPNGRVVKSILLNRDNRSNQSSSAPEQRIHNPPNQDRDKRPPRPPGVQSFHTNGSLEDNKGVNTSHTDKIERRTRNKDRPDRGVWTPLRRSDGSHASDESLSSSASQTSQLADSVEGTNVDMKHVGGRGGNYSDNGYHNQGGRRGSSYSSIKDTDGSLLEGKSTKKGGSGYGSSEKQVWVQKSGAGS